MLVLLFLAVLLNGALGSPALAQQAEDMPNARLLQAAATADLKGG